MIIDVISGPPGCGKTTYMRKAAIEEPGLYIFAAPTLKLIEEQACAFRAEAPGIDLTEVHSGASGKGSVQRRLHNLIDRIEGESICHAVALVTHEAIMGADLSAFGGWHARIDESPASVQGGILNISASTSLLSQMFELEPVGASGWAQVKPLMDQQKWSDIASDTPLQSMSELLKQVWRPGGAYVNTHVWKKSVGWCSVWLPDSLSHFETIHVAGASYLTSLGAVIAQRHLRDEIKFVPRYLKMVRSAHPSVRIHYFVDGHEGTSKLWSESAGRAIVVPICDFLSQNVPGLGYWSGNEQIKVLMEHRLSGEMIGSKAAGLNSFRDKTSCAFIYSSKKTPNDDAMQSLFDISDDEIRAAREDDDILQFIMRGAIRESSYGGDYDIYVYNLRQASTLHAQLTASGVGQSITLIPEVSAGVMHAQPHGRKTPRQQPSALKLKDRKIADAERQRSKRANLAAENGRQPGVSGRPRRPRADL